MDFSKYIVYVDESGDHGLKSIDDQYPIFVLAFCIFHKSYYIKNVVPAIQEIKFNYFGHDSVVLHEHEIRKEKYPFNIFKSKNERLVFLEDLTKIIESSKFVVISGAIKKQALASKYHLPSNPYYLALNMCLEGLFLFLKEKNNHESTTHIVFEKRGSDQDKLLELAFLRFTSGQNRFNQKIPFIPIFVDKKANSAGLQLADLIARPIGLHVLNPSQKNRAFDTIQNKFYCKNGGQDIGKDFEGYGLKIFP